METGIILTRYR